jgi:Na+-translocating ferredoxin:NAD+ oxidoreductase subunit G
MKICNAGVPPATQSNLGPRRPESRRSYKIASVFLFLLFITSIEAKLITREEALKLAFPGAQIQSSIVFLTDEEVKEVTEKTGESVPSPLVARYLAVEQGKEVGRAYLDTHTVRTKKESLLVILTPDGKVKRVEVVAFLEPPEYQPNERWYQQFEGKELNPDLQLNRAIHPVTGATLTARATTAAVRRILAIDALLLQKKQGAYP